MSCEVFQELNHATCAGHSDTCVNYRGSLSLTTWFCKVCVHTDVHISTRLLTTLGFGTCFACLIELNQQGPVACESRHGDLRSTCRNLMIEESIGFWRAAYFQRKPHVIQQISPSLAMESTGNSPDIFKLL